MNTPTTTRQDKRTLGYLLPLAVVLVVLLTALAASAGSLLLPAPAYGAPYIRRRDYSVDGLPPIAVVVGLLLLVTAWLFKLFKVWQKRQKRKQEEGSA